MKTSNGFKYYIKNNVCTLFIPATKGIYAKDVQFAQRELINLEYEGKIKYFEEIKFKKVGSFSI